MRHLPPRASDAEVDAREEAAIPRGPITQFGLGGQYAELGRPAEVVPCGVVNRDVERQPLREVYLHRDITYGHSPADGVGLDYEPGSPPLRFGTGLAYKCRDCFPGFVRTFRCGGRIGNGCRLRLVVLRRFQSRFRSRGRSDRRRLRAFRCFFRPEV